MLSDEELMRGFQQGSRECFEELFERYRQPLYAFFFRRLRSVARAEELRQETFVAVLRARERYEPRARVRTYLYGIALKLVAAERRKQRTAGELSMQDEDVVNASSDDALWVREALEKLDPNEREILMLREYEQLSYAE